MRIFCFLLLTLSVYGASAAESKNANLIAIGQGISSPSSTSTVNYSSGYTSESPLGTIYQNGFRLSGHYDKNGHDAYGGELGYGMGQWGLAGGHHKRDCEGCDGTSAGALGIVVSDVGLGIRFAEDLYAAALLFNPHGKHRFGIMAERNESAGRGSHITAYGAGYSYVGSQITFTIDASKRDYENKTVTDERVLVTPGLMVRADILQLSVNDKITLNKDENNRAHDEDEDHELWFGVGLGGDKFHLAFYADYVNEIALVGSLFF